MSLYRMSWWGLFSLLLASCGGGGGGGTPTPPQSTVPVAVAPAVFALGPYVMLDGSQSHDPQGKALTYSWTIAKPPTGWGSSWGGWVDASAKGTIAFYTYRGDSPWTGSFDVTLTVSNGTQTSAALTVPVTVCCATNESVANASAFVSKLPTYSIAQARTLYQNFATTDWVSDFKFAASYQLGFAELDFLKGVAPGTSLGEMRKNAQKYVSNSGGATITNASLTFNNVVQVPADLSKVNYPTDYWAQNAKTVAITQPFCDLNPAYSSYRSVDVGSFQLPAINAVALPANTLKLAYIKDIWGLTNPGIADGCVNDVALAWTTTLDKLKQLGVNAIAVTPWTYFFKSTTGWTLPVAGTNPWVSTMTDDHLKWVIGQAHARGLKVYWVNQIQAVQLAQGGMLSPEATTLSDVQDAVSTMKTYLTERGKTLQAMGVDGAILGTWYWVNFASYLGDAGMSAAATQLINAMKQNFQGEIVYGPSSVMEIGADLKQVVNRFVYNTYVGFDSTSFANYSVSTIKSQYQSGLTDFKNAIGSAGLIFDTSIQSRAGFFTSSPGYFDPFCTPSGNNPCIQDTLVGDYSMQSVWTEAVLEVAASQGAALGGVFMAYFVHPNLLPPASYFNTDATVRGKPAEYIFYKWFNQK